MLKSPDRKQTQQRMPCVFAGESFVMDARGVLFWPTQSMLIVSDLHFEKGSFLQQFAHPIPAYDTLDTLSRLEAIVHEYQPEQVVCLGDSFHDRHAGHRLSQADRQKIAQLCARVTSWHWVLGNHDPAIPDGLPGLSHGFIDCAGIRLTHEPTPTDRPQIIGHYHPKAKLKIKGQTIRGKCFLSHESLMLMPAFGSFTGGLDRQDDALQTLFCTPYQTYLLFEDQIWHID